jgi:hypothetical protein
VKENSRKTAIISIKKRRGEKITNTPIINNASIKAKNKPITFLRFLKNSYAD